MKHPFILTIAALAVCASCADDRDSNPVLTQPQQFVLNTPPYAAEAISLANTDEMPLTWSQPQFTADNAPVNATYEVQVSPTGSFTVSDQQAAADESGATVPDYAVIDRRTTQCTYNLATADLNRALVKIAKWTEDAVPATQTVTVRVSAYIEEGTSRLAAINSNPVQLNTVPYYVELKDAAPMLFYLVGNNIADGGWSNKPGESSLPLFVQAGVQYDKKTGAGEITYLNYFDPDGWKLQPADFNWDMGFMGDGANAAVFRNGGADAGNIWCDPAGIYRVTVNTGTNTCTIAAYDGPAPDVYPQVCITGSFNDWADADMLPANKAGENHVWYYTLTVAPGQTEQIKFKQAGSWDVNWGYGAADGEVNTCGKGTNGGKNIGVPEGTWIIAICDITGEFSIVPMP